jgi:hypothetical protein
MSIRERIGVLLVRLHLSIGLLRVGPGGISGSWLHLPVCILAMHLILRIGNDLSAIAQPVYEQRNDEEDKESSEC